MNSYEGSCWDDQESRPDIGRAVVDVATAWDARLCQAMRRKSAIIALRGAGSTGGIDPEAADRVIEDELIPEVQSSRGERPVAIVYDGDQDNPDKPDIGYVVGRLRDRFSERDGVSFLAAQANSWYYPDSPGANLTNANRQPYETFVFPRGAYPGDHNRFTQSGQLARYPRYRQVYVGAAGMIATEQMQDYCRKAGEGRVNITVIRALINQALSTEIGDKLASAVTEVEREKFARMQTQRQRVYGTQWENDGRFDPGALAELQEESDTHELVVLWEGSVQTPHRVDIVNARRVDLRSPEADALFEQARYFNKTRPIRARQIPEGKTETVIVNSGATRDKAQGGDWVCTSVGIGEEYVVHADDFPDIYEYIKGSDGIFRPKPDPRRLVKVDTDIIFRAPWGEDQAVRAGGFLIERTIRSGPRAGKTERYGIAQKDVESDFEPVV